MQHTKKPRLKRRTYLEYEYIIDHHLKPAIATLRLDKLTTNDLQRLYSTKVDEGLSAQRIRNIHAVIRGALTYAVKCQMVVRNVAQMVTLPKIELPEVQVLTPEQARIFLAEARGSRYEALFALALATGMRQGELLGLRWCDVDLDAGLVQVRRTLANHKGHRWLDIPKTHRSKRPIPVGNLAVAALRAHEARQAEERLAAGPEWQDKDGLVFTTGKGTSVIAAHLVNRDFKPLLREAGLPDIKFHALRHSTATMLLGENEHTKLVQDLLGHSQSTVTLDIYSHTSAAMLRETAAKLDRLLSTG